MKKQSFMSPLQYTVVALIVAVAIIWSAVPSTNKFMMIGTEIILFGLLYAGHRRRHRG